MLRVTNSGPGGKWGKTEESTVVGPLALAPWQLLQANTRQLIEQYRAADALERCMWGWQDRRVVAPCSN